MQLKHLIQSLQSILADHGNVDVVVFHPNADPSISAGTPLFHLDVLPMQSLDPLVQAGVGSVNGLRQYTIDSPVKTIVRLTPYSMERVQGLHDMRNGLPVTPTPPTDLDNGEEMIKPSQEGEESQPTSSSQASKGQTTHHLLHQV